MDHDYSATNFSVSDDNDIDIPGTILLAVSEVSAPNFSRSHRHKTICISCYDCPLRRGTSAKETLQCHHASSFSAATDVKN